MTLFQGLFFLIFGAALLLVDHRALSDGTLSFWSYGFNARTEFSRVAHPAR